MAQKRDERTLLRWWAVARDRSIAFRVACDRHLQFVVLSFVTTAFSRCEDVKRGRGRHTLTRRITHLSCDVSFLGFRRAWSLIRCISLTCCHGFYCCFTGLHSTWLLIANSLLTVFLSYSFFFTGMRLFLYRARRQRTAQAKQNQNQNPLHLQRQGGAEASNDLTRCDRFARLRPSTSSRTRSCWTSSPTCRTARSVVWRAPVANGAW